MDLVEVKHRSGDKESRHPWELARLKVVASLLEKHMVNDHHFNVVDIGCGDIFFISELSKIYPKINFYAVDTAFSDEIIDVLKKDAQGKRIKLFKDLEAAAEDLGKPADLILLLDVVEHISDDGGFLRYLNSHAVVSSDTIIMITVPAFQSLFCSHDHFLGHYRRYTNSTLSSLISSTGFRHIKIGYFFSSLVLPRIFQVLKERVKKPADQNSTTGLVEWNRGSFVTEFFKSILQVDHKISSFIKKFTGVNLPGLSNYVICKKAA